MARMWKASILLTVTLGYSATALRTCKGFPGFCSESFPGSTCTVVCERGRPNVPLCQEDGTWTDIPRCIEHEPGRDEQIPGICPGVSGYCSSGYIGDRCQFPCKVGRSIDSKCTADGTWFPYPTCVDDIRETQDGCDPCPGPQGKARNRPLESLLGVEAKRQRQQPSSPVGSRQSVPTFAGNQAFGVLDQQPQRSQESSLQLQQARQQASFQQRQQQPAQPAQPARAAQPQLNFRAAAPPQPQQPRQQQPRPAPQPQQPRQQPRPAPQPQQPRQQARPVSQPQQQPRQSQPAQQGFSHFDAFLKQIQQENKLKQQQRSQPSFTQQTQQAAPRQQTRPQPRPQPQAPRQQARPQPRPQPQPAPRQQPAAAPSFPSFQPRNEQPAPERRPAPRPAPVQRQPAPRTAPVQRQPAPRPAPVQRQPAPRPAPVQRQPEPRPAPRSQPKGETKTVFNPQTGKQETIVIKKKARQPLQQESSRPRPLSEGRFIVGAGGKVHAQPRRQQDQDRVRLTQEEKIIIQNSLPSAVQSNQQSQDGFFGPFEEFNLGDNRPKQPRSRNNLPVFDAIPGGAPSSNRRQAAPQDDQFGPFQVVDL